MLHAVLELVKKIFLSELGRLETNLVVQRRTVGKLNLLVYFLLSDSFLTFERIEGAD